MGLQPKLREAIDRAVTSGMEIGLQVAVYRGDELIADAWAGHADAARTRLVDGDTLFTVFSATKAPAALAVHIQAERGLLDYDQPVAHYWPEFGQHGKEATTVRDALLHRSGVPQMPLGTTPEQMCDWEGMCVAVAALEPLWKPGTKSGYHAYTFGWIMGELVRRTDTKHRPFAQWVQDEICAPLGIRDLWLGIPEAVESRIAEIIDLPPASLAAIPENSPLRLAIPFALNTGTATFGRLDVRRSCHPGAGGIMNARSLARMYACLASGGKLDGARLVSAARVDAMRRCYTDEVDAVIGTPYRRGLGFWLGGQPPGSDLMGPNPGAFGHPGAGGAIGWCDPEAGVSVALLKNRMLAPATAAENPLLAIAEVIRTES